MALFNKLFKKQENEPKPVPDCDPFVVYAPADGAVIPLDEFPDEVFSAGVLGPGCGILPSGNLVTAPFNGVVTQVIDTLHAVGLTSDSGVELLIHVGVDTVDMKGKGFQTDVKTGQTVLLGEPLIVFSRAEIEAAGHADAIAVIVTNGEEYVPQLLRPGDDVRAGEAVMQIKK